MSAALRVRATALLLGLIISDATLEPAGTSSAFSQSPAAATPGVTGVVYVIRHGEKVPAGNHLNVTGHARAQCVAQLWGGGRHSRYESPKAIFANLFGEEYNSVELATPLGRKIGVPVNSSYHRPAWGNNNSDVVSAMLQKVRETGGPVMVVWESWNLVPIVRELGCGQPWSWLANYDGRMWGRGHQATKFDNFFIVRLENGSCADVQLHQEGCNVTSTWAKNPLKLRSGLEFELPSHPILALFILVATVAGAVWAHRMSCSLRGTWMDMREFAGLDRGVMDDYRALPGTVKAKKWLSVQVV